MKKPVIYLCIAAMLLALPAGAVSVTLDGASAAVSGLASGGKVLFAAYGANGRMRGAAVADADGLTDLSAFEGLAVRAMPVDGDSRPTEQDVLLTESLEVPKESRGLLFRSNGDGTCELYGMGTCTDTALIIPETSPEGDTVTFISAGAFRGNAALTEVQIPDCVEKIGLGAFADCPNLAPLNVPLYKIAVGDLPAETVEQAVMAAALAFYHKNPYMQYDANLLTVESKAKGSPRRTTYQTPENTAWDSRHYSQCSEYCFDVWYEAMGLEFMGDRFGYGNHVYEDKFAKSIVTGYDTTSKGAFLNLTDRAEANRILEEESRPGDIVLGYGSPDTSGHVILIAGDIDGDGKNDVLHCWPIGGGNFDAASGAQKDEPNGSIKMQTVKDLLLTTGSTPNWCVTKDVHGARWYLFRPSLMTECKSLYLTPATVTRMEYPDMEIAKSADRSIFDDAAEGEQIVITEKISNLGKQDYEALPVTEVLPDGAVLVSADAACSAEGTTLRWTLDIPAGGSATVTYTVKNTLPMGDTLFFPAGSVGAIPSRSFSLRVGGARLSETQNSALEKISRGVIPAALQGIGFKDMDFFNYFYREILGADISLPKTVSAYVSGNFSKKTSDGKAMLTEKASAPQASMTLPKHPGGQYLTTGNGKNSTENRLMDVREDFYRPGDLFVILGGSSTQSVKSTADITLLVYVGSGKLLQHTTAGTSVVSFSSSVIYMLKDNLFTVLRPTLAYDDLGAEIQIPEGGIVTVTTLAELKFAASNTEVEEIRINGTIDLNATVNAGMKKVTILSGSTVNLKSYDINAGALTVEGSLTATTGSVCLQSVSETQTKQFLAQYKGLPVFFTCRYDDPDINNAYDCGTDTAFFRQTTASLGKKNVDQMLSEIPAGWTIKLTCGLVSSSVLNIPQKNLTLDVNGVSFGMKNYTGEPFRVINSNPSKGGFYFRGAVDGDTRTLETSIDASGAKVILGWTSAANVCTLKVTGSLICGQLELNNGSSISGNYTVIG